MKDLKGLRHTESLRGMCDLKMSQLETQECPRQVCPSAWIGIHSRILHSNWVTILGP